MKKENINKDDKSWSQLLLLADRHQCRHLKAAALAFLQQHLQFIIKVGWGCRKEEEKK